MFPLGEVIYERGGNFSLIDLRHIERADVLRYSTFVVKKNFTQPRYGRVEIFSLINLRHDKRARRRPSRPYIKKTKNMFPLGEGRPMEPGPGCLTRLFRWTGTICPAAPRTPKNRGGRENFPPFSFDTYLYNMPKLNTLGMSEELGNE